MVTWMFLAWWRGGKPTVTGAMAGAVAGLATVTPAAGFVPPWAAVLIGLLAAVACYFAIQFRIRRNWDDALDVWGVHGVGGGLGTILTGLFEGNTRQFGVQVLGVAIAAVYAFAVTFAILKVIDRFVPVRVPSEVEVAGLDTVLLGEVAYDVV